jgi:hypothetical protein
MRRPSLTLEGSFVFLFLLVALRTPAQDGVLDGAEEDAPATQEQSEQAAPGLQEPGPQEPGVQENVAGRRPHENPDWARFPGHERHPAWGWAPPWAGAGWGYAPWWYAPPTVPYKAALYPPPVAVEPRLGLHTNYPYAWQAGILIPPDSDPWEYRDLGPFVGVVGAAKAALREEELRESREAEDGGGETGRGRDEPPGAAEAIALMREGKYREAGKLLARHFEALAHPRYPLLLAEVFFALGKYDHAQLLLHQALGARGGAASLSLDAPSHFPSPDVFEGMLERLLESQRGGPTRAVLLAYFLLQSNEPAKAVEVITRRLTAAPDDGVAALLYRHSLKHSF